MAHKLAVITDENDRGAWIVARHLNEIAKRHAGSIEVDYIDNIKLGDLADGDMLYVMGHGSPTDIHGGYDGKKVAETLVKQGLPQGKRVRIRLLSCETGLYSENAKVVAIGSEMVELRESLTRDLKNALTYAGFGACTLEVPLGNVVVLSASDGDNAILPAKSSEAQKKCGQIFSTVAGLSAVNPKVQRAIKAGTPALKVAQTFAVEKPVVDFFSKWNAYVKTVIYPGVEGWRIVST